MKLQNLRSSTAGKRFISFRDKILPDYNEAAEWHLHLPAKTKIQINIVFIDLLLANFISEHTCVEILCHPRISE